MIRMDRGTENTKVAALHYAMRETENDEYSGPKSVQFGTSPANIVILIVFFRSSGLFLLTLIHIAH